MIYTVCTVYTIQTVLHCFKQYRVCLYKLLGKVRTELEWADVPLSKKWNDGWMDWTGYPDLIFVKKFTRSNFRAKESYTMKTRKLRLFSPAIKRRKCIIISNMVLFGLKLNKMNSYEKKLHQVCVNLQNM